MIIHYEPIVIGVITTKDRLPKLKNAIQSIYNQTVNVNDLIVVSDSDEVSYREEHVISKSYGATIIKNRRNKNYAGSLNTAIEHIISIYACEKLQQLEDIYLAILDDDDIWHKNYIEKCISSLKANTDFVVCGINYHTESEIKKLSIPQILNIQDFLKGNPHIQGSNTFIRLTTLLKAGCFDENMSSVTDRDLFTRVMMLSPQYTLVNEYLVDVFAFSFEKRITNNLQKKVDGLTKFYQKYQGIMDSDSENYFFNRISTLFKINRDELISNIKTNQKISSCTSWNKHPYTGKLVVGFTITEKETAIRLLYQLTELKRANTKIVVFINFKGNFSEITNILLKSNYEYEIITLQKVIGNKESFGSFINTHNFSTETLPFDIASSRTILHKYLYDYSVEGDVIWIVDDDMELKELVINDNRPTEREVKIDNIISEYIGRFDVVIGRYSLDAPLPMLSTIRTSLIDYLYSKVLNFGVINTNLHTYNDYYYDLADNVSIHLETPYFCDSQISLDDVFTGKACSRKLFVVDSEIQEVKNRGGNTLIFNREVLKVPNVSLRFGGITGRRSDYLWVLLLKQKGYNLCNAPFALYHNRKPQSFNYDNEIDKLQNDIIGSSMTKTFDKEGLEIDFERFSICYKKELINRLTRFCKSYFRIIGILEILGESKYKSQFLPSKIYYFISTLMSFTDISLLNASYLNLKRDIYINEQEKQIPRFSDQLKKQYNLSELSFLGSGSEGMVFTNDIYVYKLFYNVPCNIDFLERISPTFENCDQLYMISIEKFENTIIIRYKKSKSTERYKGGFAFQLTKLLNYGKNNGFVFTNIKSSNFIVDEESLKFIDYGSSIEQFDEGIFNRSIERAYQMFRYHFLSEIDFKRLINLSYKGLATEINAGVDSFLDAMKTKYKENIHDPIVIKRIKELTPKKILDFGAGKCKIANILSNNFNVSVYDIDNKTLIERANSSITIIDNISLCGDNEFDLVNCNQVICWLDDEYVAKIMSDISRLLEVKGKLILSICNPFFSDIQHTHLRSCGRINDYSTSNWFDEYNSKGNHIHTERHRPIEFYLNLINKYGFKIINIYESNGVDCDNIMPIGEHLIFDCTLVSKPNKLDNLSLLIKCNPMEYNTIYENVRHKVFNLEKGMIFSEKIIIVDCGINNNRLRMYNEENLKVLLDEIQRLKINGFIDSVYLSPNQMSIVENIYSKYFGNTTNEMYSHNGQQLFASLYGFECVRTRFVYQTDSDIIIKNSTYKEFSDAFELFKQKQALTLSLSVCKNGIKKINYGERTEVRSCFIDLDKIKLFLPFENKLIENKFELPWHRCVDKIITSAPNLSIRLSSSCLWILHPQNFNKLNINFIQTVIHSVENNDYFKSQQNNIDLIGQHDNWLNKTNSKVVIYIRGHNTPPTKLKRLFDSLIKQTFQNFQIVYVDDASTNCSGDYAKFILGFSKEFSERTIIILNKERMGELPNLNFVMKNIVVDMETIVINIDNDDYLINNDAIKIIYNEFMNGADITCGNCIRYDKPLKKYKILSFEKFWESNGNNIWLHPKCFLRKLYEFVDEYDLKIDNDWIDINTDYAFMAPMIYKSSKPVFIDKVLYYFEPSKDNISSKNKYNKTNKLRVLNEILTKIKVKYEKDSFSNR